MALDAGRGEPQVACLGQSRCAGPICSVGKMGCGSQMRSRYSLLQQKLLGSTSAEEPREPPAAARAPLPRRRGAPSQLSPRR